MSELTRLDFALLDFIAQIEKRIDELGIRRDEEG